MPLPCIALCFFRQRFFPGRRSFSFFLVSRFYRCFFFHVFFVWIVVEDCFSRFILFTKKNEVFFHLLNFWGHLPFRKIEVVFHFPKKNKVILFWGLRLSSICPTIVAVFRLMRPRIVYTQICMTRIDFIPTSFSTSPKMQLTS